MINRLRFLFTGAIWWIQEECCYREHDCAYCGAGMDHASSIYFSKKAALAAAVDFVEQMAGGEDAVIQAQDEGNDFMVFTESREYSAHVYRTQN